MPGPVLVVIALALWGTWGFLNKHAVDRAHPFTVQWMTATTYVIALPIWFALGRRANPATNTDPRVFALAGSGALCGLFATVCVLFALRHRDASYVIAVTSGYPMVTYLLAVATGLESFSLARAAGVLLIVSGVGLLAVTGK